jgi:hypothetical protein
LSDVSEQFADYRDQLLSWEECEPKLAEYCQQLGFPMVVNSVNVRVRLQGFLELLMRAAIEE